MKKIRQLKERVLDELSGENEYSELDCDCYSDVSFREEIIFFLLAGITFGTFLGIKYFLF
jgi:hypothetical protein